MAGACRALRRTANELPTGHVPTETMPLELLLGQQRLDCLPEVIRDEGLGRHGPKDATRHASPVLRHVLKAREESIRDLAIAVRSIGLPRDNHG
jgi:hypothetical protein